MEQKLCVLIDFENIAAGAEKEGHGRFDIRAVMRRLKDKGRILVSRAYGDWGRFAKFKQDLLEQGVTMVELTSYRGQEKNRADIALVVDAMELAFTREYIDTFVLMSGDSDFTPLVSRLKELNRRVIGLGTRGSTSRLIIEGCDEFIFYESLRKREVPEKGRKKPTPEQRPAEVVEEDTELLDQDEAMALIVETVEGIQKDQPGPVLAGLVKQSIQRKEPAFDEGDYGYAGFARFLEAAQARKLVRLAYDEKAGGYRVDIYVEGAPPVAAPVDVAELPVEEDEVNEEAALPELPGEAAHMRALLAGEGVNPLTRMIRHTVVHEFVDHVGERQARKKRNTLMYVYGDIARRCRKTDPVVPATQVRPVINALRLAGELKHSDGNPVRSNTAPFTINKDAEELLESLDHFFLHTLLDKGSRLDDASALSWLLWGDAHHVREAGQLAAWVLHDRTAPTVQPTGAPVDEVDPPTEVAPTPAPDEDSQDEPTEPPPVEE